MHDMKAQASVEFLLVVGVATVISLPFILEAQGSVQDVSQDNSDAIFESSFDKLERSVERVNSMGPPAGDSVTLELPDNVIGSSVVENAIVFTAETPSGNQNYSRIMDARINSASVPNEGGTKMVNVKATDNGVNITSTILQAAFESESLIVANQEATFTDESDSINKVITEYTWRVDGNVEKSGPGAETFSYTFSDTSEHNVSLEVIDNEGDSDQISKIYSPAPGTVFSEVLSYDSQADWNQGYFNQTSADRNDNSGDLGLGYLNRTNLKSGNLEEDLVGYWRLDSESGSVVDYSGEGNDGSAENGVTRGVDGILGGQAFDFDGGDDYVNLPNLGFSGDQSITSTAWVKVNSNAGDTNNIFGFGNSGNGDEVYSIRTKEDGGWRFYFWGNDLDASTLNYYGKWTHVAAVYDSVNNRRYIYVNGDQVASDSPSDPNFQDNTYRISGFNNEYFDGKIDEIRVYDRAVSQSEVKDLYLSGRPFRGDYTSEVIKEPTIQDWSELELDASVPSSTELTAEFQSLTESVPSSLEKRINSVNEWQNGQFNGSTVTKILPPVASDQKISGISGFKLGEFNGSTVDKPNYPIASSQVVSNLLGFYQGQFSGSTANRIEQNISISEASLTTQSAFNSGDFNGTSVDRKDNSGDLGLGYRNGVPEDNLVGYWRFDGESGSVVDYSGENNDGSTQNFDGDERGVNGTFGTQAFEFDGNNNYVKTDYNGLGSQGKSFSVSIWLKSSYSFSGNHFPINNYVDNGHNGFFAIGSDDPSQGMYFWLRDDNSNTLAKTGYYDPAWDGNWHHYVGVRDIEDNEVRFYIDGELKETITTSNTNPVKDGDSFLGFMRHNGRSDQTNSGKLDEVRAYNDRALNTSEVKDLYFNGRPFKGDYSAEKIDNDELTNWNQIEIDSSVPSDTGLSAEFEALDSSGSVIDSRVIDVSDGSSNYSLSVSDSEDARVKFNGTSSNVSKSWEVHDFEVYSQEADVLSDGLRIGYRNGSAGDDLVGYWRMDGGSGDRDNAIDYSGNNQDASYSNGVSTGVNGIFGTNSSSFDGSDDVASTSLSQINSDHSYSVWFKTPSGSNQGAIYTHWSSSSATGSLIGRCSAHPNSCASTDSMSFTIRWENGNANTIETQENYADGKWHHMVATLDHSDGTTNGMEIYIDGEDVSTSVERGQGSGDSLGNNQASIGRSVSRGNTFNGKIDELQIFDKELNSTEVKNLYLNGRPFQGNYTAQRIDNDVLTDWNSLEVNASVPSDTGLSAEFEALDSSGSVIDSEQIDIGSGLNNYSVSVSDSEDARVKFNGTSSNVSKSWEVNDFKVFSQEADTLIEGLRIGYSNGSTSDDLVGYWRMDTNGHDDFSGNSRDGLEKGGLEKDRSGILSTGSYGFDGSGEGLEVSGIGTALNDANEFTISMWVNYDQFEDYKVAYGNQQSGFWTEPYRDGSEGVSIRIRDSSGNNHRLESGDVLPSSNQWYFVSYTWDGQYLRAYRNNTKVGELDTGGRTLDISADHFIGSYGNGANNQIDAKLDEVRVYNRSLSESEIEELYFHGRPFEGNYTDEKIDNNVLTDWDQLEVNASGISGDQANLSAEFEALDSSGTVIDSQLIDLSEGMNNYSLSVSDSEDGRLKFNGSSSDVSKSWGVDGFEIYSRDADTLSEGLRIGYRNGSGGDDLVGYWRLDREFGSVVDYSGRVNDGTSSGATRGVNGTFSTQAFEFDGQSTEVSVPTSIDHDSFTISAWVNTDVFDGNYRRIYESRNSANDLGFSLGINTANRWSFYNNDGSGSYDLESSSQTDTNEWKHVVAMYNASSQEKQLWINGVKEASSTVNLDVDPAGTSTIGNDPHFDEHWDGEIDEIRIYNRSLSGSEVERLYFDGRPFKGNYTAEVVEKDWVADWEKVGVNASVPSGTDLSVRFRPVDGEGNALDEQVVDVSDGSGNYSLDVEDSRRAEVLVNGSSSNVTKTWNLYDLEVYSSRPEVGESESFDVQGGNPQNYSLSGLSDSRSARVRFNGSSSNVNESWRVSDLSVFSKE